MTNRPTHLLLAPHLKFLAPHNSFLVLGVVPGTSQFTPLHTPLSWCDWSCHSHLFGWLISRPFICFFVVQCPASQLVYWKGGAADRKDNKNITQVFDYGFYSTTGSAEGWKETSSFSATYCWHHTRSYLCPVCIEGADRVVEHKLYFQLKYVDKPTNQQQET